MAISLAIIVLLGLLASDFFRRMGLPELLGMLLVGILLGPYVLNAIDPSLLQISADLRMIALIVILLRAGLKIKRKTINEVGPSALALSFIPSTLEGLAVTFVGHLILGLPLIESAMLGFIVAAVSPAVVVPSMIKLIEKKRGTEKGIPTMILAASSLDNAYVIVVFSAVMGMHAGTGKSIWVSLLEIPSSIVLGTLAGLVIGHMLYTMFNLTRTRATKMTLIVLGFGMLLTWVQKVAGEAGVAFSSLIAVMALGFLLLEKSEESAHAISNKLGKIWVAAEILLFVLVGAQVNIHVAWDAGLEGLAIISIGLIARSAGTFVSLSFSKLNMREKLFCIIAYLPKATVQAAVGAIPLSAGVPGGEVILAVAVLSILVTAPLGAIGINLTEKRLLKGRRIRSSSTEESPEITPPA